MSRCRAVQHVIKALYVKVRKKFSRKFLIQFWSKCTKSITQSYTWRKRDVFYATQLNLDKWESPKYTSHIKWVQLRFITYSNNQRIGLWGGHCVFKWILRRHLKPRPSATILIMFEVISIKFWKFWSTIDAYEIISLTQTFLGA